jgi:ABC-2 type transport system ATP-binding protein
VSGIISVCNVSKSFGKLEVLKNISISINKGACIGIVGTNGSGKSVLFKLIAGLERATMGEIIVKNQIIGKDIDFPSDIGILIDEPGFIELYSGFDNLRFLAAIKSNLSDAELTHVMEQVGLSINPKTKVKNYSMGMKKKLGIAQAIMEKQDIILLDEPFNALDFQTVLEIKDIIKKLKSEKNTILLTGHNHTDLEELCDEIYYLNNGALVLFDEELQKQYFKR